MRKSLMQTGIRGLFGRGRNAAQPVGKAFLIVITGGEGEHLYVAIDSFRVHFHTIPFQEQTIYDKGCAFVAIEEGMIFCDAKSVGSGKRAKIGWRIAIAPTLLGSGQCRQQKTFIPQSGLTAVFCKLAIVDGNRKVV